MLMTDMRNDWVQTFIARTDRVDLDRLNAAWDALEQEATGYFASEGIAPANLVLTRSADMRYLGQEHTVNVALPPGRFDGDFSAIHERFHALHEQFYAFRIPGSPIEFVNLRAVGIGTVRKPEIVARDEGPADPGPAIKGRRMVNYDSDGWRESTLYERDRLQPGMRLAGPAIVEEPAATTVIFPGQQLRVDRYGNLIVEEA
jgi:N-methylhydantoinase A